MGIIFVIMTETTQFREKLNQAVLQSDVVKIFDNLLTIAVED
ncbi:MAG: hypothetical protein WCG25_02930 [bacterium]